MIKRLTLCLIFSFICLIFLNSCKQPTKGNDTPRPTLVIGIVVDQMRYDYLYRYYTKYSDGGFKRLLKEGFSFDDAEFNYVPTYTAPGHTSIYTGTTPCVHGMVANEWYDRKLHKTVYCVEDTTVKTVGSISNEGMMSPRRELTTTIGDELKLSGAGKSKVIGVSLKDRASILPAGHSADAAYWFDGITGNWITSTYYMKDLPGWVKKFNAEQKAQKYLSTPWNTLLPIEQYYESTKDSNHYEGVYKGEKEPVFPHDLKGLMQQNGGYALLRTTPFGDDLTKDFAIAAIENEQLGKNGVTDMLTISFSSTDYIGHQFGTRAIETEDTYLRLDKNIAELLSFLDGYIGKGKVLIFLTADHGAALNPQYLLDRNIPAGYVDEMQVNARVKSALLNKYGTDLVSEIVNQQCYLDKQKISDRGLNLDSVEFQTARVLSQITGIERAIPACNLNNSGNDFIINKIRNGYYYERSGDVIFNIMPAWLMYQKTGTTHGSPYIDDAHVPMIFYGWHISHGCSGHLESITNIAPTLAELLHISCPDGCTGHPISQISKK